VDLFWNDPNVKKISGEDILLKVSGAAGAVGHFPALH
jgi:hypothetical protein